MGFYIIGVTIDERVLTEADIDRCLSFDSYVSYNPLEGGSNDRYYKKIVLMKCEVCDYSEVVEEAMLERIRDLPPLLDEDRILCPFCLNYMYRSNSPRFTKSKNQ